MSKILELREKRNKIWNTAKEFLDQKRGENGLVPAEAAAEYEKMETDMVALGKEIERLERQAAYDIEMGKPTSAPITNAPTKPDVPKTGRASDEYKADFGNILRGKQPINNVLSTSPDTDGGYLVPLEFERQIVMGLQEANVVRSIAKTISTSAERKIPIAATHSTARWTLENAAIIESNPTFEQKTIDAFKLTDLIKVSVELLQDSMFDLESYIVAEFARAFGIAEEESFCIGSGTGQPTGIFTAQGGEIGVTTTGAAITTDNLIDLVYSLKSPYRRNAVFLMRDITVSAIRKLKDSNGQYLWQPSVKEATPDTLIARPLYTSAYMPIIAAAAKTMVFGDFSYYWVADRQGRVFKRLNELYAKTGQVGFLATQRVDGKLILPEAVKILQQKAS